MMHATPRPFADLLPAIDAVFADERIVGRFAPAERLALRRRAEASMMTYVATEAVRLRAYATAARSAAKAIAHRPAGAPRAHDVGGRRHRAVRLRRRGAGRAAGAPVARAGH
jgi:hypothetical protein